MNDKNDEKKLDFWDFEAIRNNTPPGDVRQSPFPSNRLVSEQEMNFYFDKLQKRMEKYKDNKCYHFLDGFLEFTKRHYMSSNEKECSNQYENAMTCLKLFTSCWEEDRQKSKINTNNNSLL